MEKLISESEIKKSGFEKESNRVYFKSPNSRYVLCGLCGSWTLTNKRPDNEKLSDECYWCRTTWIIPINVKNTKLKTKSSIGKGDRETKNG